MMKKHLTLIILLIITSPSVISQTAVIDSLLASFNRNKEILIKTSLLNEIKKDSNKSVNNIDFNSSKYKINLKNNKTVTLKDVEKTLDAIKENYLKNNAFTGKFGFSLGGNSANNNEQTQINLIAGLKKGTFPSEFNFDANVNIQFNNGKLIENLSNLIMSYDHHLDDNLAHEMYLFVKRSNNNFLNIDQRYEFGSGYIFNAVYSGNKLTKATKDEEVLKKYLNREGREAYLKYKFHKFLSKDTKQEDFLENFLAICNDGDICKLLDSTITKNPKFKKLLKENLNGIRKSGSKIRVALLMGFNYEIEETKEDLNLFYEDSTKTGNFETTSLIRFVLAPKVVYSQNDVTFTTRCFFKTAVSNNKLFNTVSLEGEDENPLFEDQKIDYRIEWESSLSIKINEKTSVKAKLNYQWINAPKRTYLNFGTETEENFQLYTSANRFLNFGVGLEMKL